MTTNRIRPFLLCLLILIALTAVTNAESHTTSADSLFAAGRFEATTSMYLQALASTPDDPVLNRRLGELALYSNRFADARSYLAAAQRAVPDDSITGRLLAELFYRRDRYDSAAPLMQRFGHEAVARKLASFGNRRPYDMSGSPDVVHVPFVQTDPLPVLRIRVNNSEPKLFILDTGAHEVFLDPEFATEVGIDVVGTTEGTFAGGKTTEVGHGIADSIGLGELTVRNVPVVMLSTKKFAAVTGGQRVYGVLGTAFLYHFLSTIDYPNGELVFRKRGSEAARDYRRQLNSAAQSDRFWLIGTHFLLAPGFLNAADTALMFMDTGLAGAAFTGPDRTFADGGITADDAEAAEGMGGGGAVRIVPVTIDSITLGPLTRTDQMGIMGAFPNLVEERFGIHVGGIVSHAFFRPYALTFDFEGMRYYLDTQDNQN